MYTPTFGKTSQIWPEGFWTLSYQVFSLIHIEIYDKSAMTVTFFLNRCDQVKMMLYVWTEKRQKVFILFTFSFLQIIQRTNNNYHRKTTLNCRLKEMHHKFTDCKLPQLHSVLFLDYTGEKILPP